MSGLPELRGKVAVVTGGASGIGEAIAAQLLAEEMEVVIADVEPGALEATAAALGATGIHTDVSDPASVEALAAQTLELFGAVHVVCNNAGVNTLGPISWLTQDDWQWILGVNLWGVINGVTTFLPILERNADGGGHIVNTASVAGLSAIPGLGAYSVTKFGVVALTETLAIELELAGSSVGATVLCPGPVRTNLTAYATGPAGRAAAEAWPHARLLEPVDVARVAVAAIKRGDLYAIPHPEYLTRIQERHQRLTDAFAAAAAQPAQ